jgi:hypothetical protein
MTRVKIALASIFLITLLGCGEKKAEESQPPQPAAEQQSTQLSDVQTPPVQQEEPAVIPAETVASRTANTRSVATNKKPAAAGAPSAVTPAVPSKNDQAMADSSHQTISESQSAANPLRPALPPVPSQPRVVTVPSGTELGIRLQDPLDSAVNKPGDTFQAVLDQDLVADGRTVAPRGSSITGKVVNAEESGRVQGRATMSLMLTELKIGGASYPIRTNTLTLEAESTAKKDATKVGIGAGLGAVIGAIAGGGKGAAIGAAVGGGAGGATVLATKGKELNFPAEHQFSFTLRSDLELQVK